MKLVGISVVERLILCSQLEATGATLAQAGRHGLADLLLAPAVTAWIFQQHC
jgi:hypothetical protein